MGTVRSALLALFGVCLGIVTTVLVMINGWGLKPQSWGWIIGVYLVGHMAAQVIIEASKHKED